jgi:hypothetical protein
MVRGKGGVMEHWRTTAVGVLILAFVAGRIAFKRDALFDAETIGLFAGACSLILGSDKLLGFGGK